MRTIFSDSWFSEFDRMLSQSFVDATVHTRKSDEGMIYEFDMPGVERDSIDIAIENSVLYVRGERNGRIISRTVTIPSVLDWNRAEADYENGVLAISVPLSEQAKPKRIEIKNTERKQIDA